MSSSGERPDVLQKDNILSALLVGSRVTDPLTAAVGSISIHAATLNLRLKREIWHCVPVTCDPASTRSGTSSPEYRNSFRSGSGPEAAYVRGQLPGGLRLIAVARGRPAYPPQRSTIRCSSFAPATLFSPARARLSGLTAPSSNRSSSCRSIPSSLVFHTHLET